MSIPMDHRPEDFNRTMEMEFEYEGPNAHMVGSAIAMNVFRNMFCQLENQLGQQQQQLELMLDQMQQQIAMQQQSAAPNSYPNGGTSMDTPREQHVDNANQFGKVKLRIREQVQRASQPLIPHGTQCPCPTCQDALRSQLNKARGEGAAGVAVPLAIIFGIVFFVLMLCAIAASSGHH